MALVPGLVVGPDAGHLGNLALLQDVVGASLHVRGLVGVGLAGGEGVGRFPQLLDGGRHSVGQGG